MRRTPPDTGFTLIEVMIVVAIVGILAGIGGWSATVLLPGYRADAAARKFVADVRSAQAIATRLNRPVELELQADLEGCGGQGYTVRAGDTVYEFVCLHPSLIVSNAGVEGFPVLGAGITATPTNGCSFCDEDGGVLVFLPTGEISNPAEPGADVALSVMPRADVVTKRSSRLRAIGIRSGSAKTKLFVPGEGKTWRAP